MHSDATPKGAATAPVRTTTSPTPTTPSAAGLSGAAITSAEKLIARLPESGGVLVLGSLTEDADETLALELALALQTISSHPAILIETRPGPTLANEIQPAASAQGLTDVLCGKAKWEDLLPARGQAGPARLGYGTQGRDAGELILSENFRHLLTSVRQRFHWVVLHAHGLMDDRHAASLIARSQGVVATLKRGQGKASDVKALHDLCAQLSRPVLGILLT